MIEELKTKYPSLQFERLPKTGRILVTCFCHKMPMLHRRVYDGTDKVVIDQIREDLKRHGIEPISN